MLIAGFAHAQAPRLELPPLTGPVIDQAGVLSSTTQQKLSALLRRVSEDGKMQLQVLILNSLNGVPIEEASIQITDQWKLGTKDQDNGVLFLIVPSERKMRIEVGQGLEGDLPDVIAKRIISDVVAPYFRENLFNEGVTAGVIEILRYGSPGSIGEEGPPPERTTHKRGIPLWIIMLFVFVFILKLIFGGGGFGGGGYRRTRGWGAGGFGGGGFGGGGGGGWSGGGGGFSGGGASGSW